MAVTYTQELLDRATAYVAQPLSSRRYAEGLAEIAALYAAITGQPVGKCQQCQYSDFLAVVVAYTREATRFLHPETVADSKYTFAPGYQNETFAHADYSKAVTADNLTDEDAKFFIGKGFGHGIVLKSSAKAESPAAEKPLTEKQQRAVRYAELFGQAPDEKVTSAQLAEHIEAREADETYQVPA